MNKEAITHFLQIKVKLMHKVITGNITKNPLSSAGRITNRTILVKSPIRSRGFNGWSQPGSAKDKRKEKKREDLPFAACKHDRRFTGPLSTPAGAQVPDPRNRESRSDSAV